MTPELFCFVGLCWRNRIKLGFRNELSNACPFHGSSILGKFSLRQILSIVTSLWSFPKRVRSANKALACLGHEDII